MGSASREVVLFKENHLNWHAYHNLGNIQTETLQRVKPFVLQLERNYLFGVASVTLSFRPKERNVNDVTIEGGGRVATVTRSAPHIRL